MVKLTYIIPNKEGGVASFVYNVILYSDKNETENTLILIGDENNNSFKRELPNCHIIKFIPSPKDTLYRRCKKFANLIPKNSIIISNDGGLEIDAFILFKLKNPLVYIIHGNLSYYYKVVSQKHFYIDTFISVSEEIAKKSNELLKKNGSKKTVKPIHAPIPYISANQQNITNTIKIIFVGRLNEYKGTPYFSKFVERLIANNISFKFTIVGTGPLESSVIELAKKYEQVTYLGHQSNKEVINLLKKHHLFFLPSLSEGLPISIVEAMKAGLVTITNNLKSGIPEIINVNRGFVFEPGDISGYVSAVKKLAQNPDLFNKMRSNAISFANKNFDPIIQTKKYISVISNTKKTISTRKSSKYFYMKLRSRFPDNLRIKLAKLLP